jgi:hypothetical protein
LPVSISGTGIDHDWIFGSIRLFLTSALDLRLDTPLVGYGHLAQLYRQSDSQPSIGKPHELVDVLQSEMADGMLGQDISKLALA